MIRVVVGEDQPIFRDGIAHVLEQGGFEVAAMAGDAPDLIRKIGAHRPDVAVADIQMPPDHAKALVGLAAQEARGGIDGLRELAAGIHPAILTTRGLDAALDALAERLPFRLELQIDEARLPPTIEASVYYFCSEALTNITKHAKAHAARIAIATDDGHLTVQISDDGIGVDHIHAGGHLAALSDRIAALEGTLDVTSPPSGGTTLTARLPLM